jgi:hypothetical protein
VKEPVSVLVSTRGRHMPATAIRRKRLRLVSGSYREQGT